MATEAPNPLAMSDDDIMNMNEPPVVEAVVVETEEEVVEETTTTEVEDKGEAVVEQTTEEASTEGAADESGEGDKSGESEEKPADTGASEADDKDKSTDETGKTEEKPEEVVETPDYEGFYKALIETPLKANGKDIKLNNLDEVKTLMQQGANYTRKMQELAPVRKSMLMLQNNGLLDDDKLAFLIDLNNGDPEALKKLIKDKNIDILDIDTSIEPAYKPGNHQVTDAEVTFDDVLSEVASTPDGRKTLSVINTTWDEQSKEALGASPEIMSVIHQQRELGIYDQITTEMNRQIALGLMPANTPFLQGYKLVGDELAKKAALPTQEAKPEPTVVVTRAAAPKAKVDNGDKASAASPTRASPKQAEEKKNFLSMSDEEFNKQSDVLLGRV